MVNTLTAISTYIIIPGGLDLFVNYDKINFNLKLQRKYGKENFSEPYSLVTHIYFELYLFVK